MLIDRAFRRHSEARLAFLVTHDGKWPTTTASGRPELSRGAPGAVWGYPRDVEAHGEQV